MASKQVSQALSLKTILSWILTFGTTFAIWRSLCFITATSTPVVCVVSESMAPAFHRGDVLFLWNRTAEVQVGDIPVVWFEGNPLPMVHRANRVFYDSEGNATR